MRFRSKLALQFLALLFSGVLFIAGILVYSFTESFDHLLIRLEGDRISRIVSDISYMARQTGFSFREEGWQTQLQAYARYSNINIVVLDQDSRIQARYEGLTKHSDQKLEVNSYLLVDAKQKELGSLLVTHDLNNPEYRQLRENFQKGALGSLALVASLFVIASFLLARSVSRRVTEPIEELSAQTARLARNDYRITPVPSKVREIQTLSANLAYLAHSLEVQDQLRLDYAQDISHELRTPLTNLSLELEALRDGLLTFDDEVAEHLEANIHQLTTIVEGLKESFDDAAQVNHFHIQPVNLTQLSEEIAASFEGAVAQKKGQLLRTLEPALNLETDPKLYRQILTNLLSNAVKAIEPGGTIRLNLSQGKKGIIVTVSDNGVGISKKALPHIFDRFYRVDSSRNRKLGGSGLGLSISKNLVHQLGGEIYVSSREGLGTSFQLTFPQDNH